jgi:uncharacterized protein YecT (DUF1311 family)
MVKRLATTPGWRPAIGQLKRSQDDWRRFRESHCNLIGDLGIGPWGSTQYVWCKVQLTRERERELRSIIKDISE